MYQDKKFREDHLIDFKRVYDRVSREARTPSNEYRLGRITECIKRCQD